MLKALWLMIKGLLRNRINENTDLRIAGREQAFENKQLIQSVRVERNNLATSLRLLEIDIEKDQEEIESSQLAVKRWNVAGNKKLEDQAYEFYVQANVNLQSHTDQANLLKTNIEKLEQQITELETEANSAKITLEIAASVQEIGKAKTSVEAAHTNINSGALSGAIESATRKDILADVTKEERKSKDRSFVLGTNKSPALSLEDLLKS